VPSARFEEDNSHSSRNKKFRAEAVADIVADLTNGLPKCLCASNSTHRKYLMSSITQREVNLTEPMQDLNVVRTQVNEPGSKLSLPPVKKLRTSSYVVHQ